MRLRFNTNPLTKETKDESINMRLTRTGLATLYAMADEKDTTANKLMARVLETFLETMEKKGELPSKAKIEAYVRELEKRADERSKKKG